MVEHKLPRKTLLLWQIRIIIIGFFVEGVFNYICRSFSWCLPASLVLAALFLLLLVWYVPTLFKTYRIKYINGALVVESGVIIKTTHIMPFTKMIYTQSIITPLAKLFGLSAVVVKAARSRILIPEIPIKDVEDFARALAEAQ